jgi:ABC-type multidrug transport system fused ATPase/permease subunit
MRVAQDQVQSDLSDLTAMMQESLQGVRIVKAFSAEEQVQAEFGGLLDRSLESQMRAVRRMAYLRPTVELIGAIGLALVVLFSSHLVSIGALTVGTLAAFLFALDVINQGLRNIGSLKQTLAQVESGTERLYSQILDVPEAHTDEAGARQLLASSGRIEFKDVSFRYPDGTQALSSVSFTIEPGSSLALVGPSGAGKSTIADLILRFYEPTDGQILFDGVDIRELKVEWLRSQIGVVPQQTFLFAGSIADNVRLGKPDATHEEVEEAAKAAHADVFVLTMPNAYETTLGERGVRLSGGEMQRISIARALIRKPTMLLLDEATSSLDAHSERAVQEALDEIMQERTTLFIAHRLTTASRADKILVLRRGEVVETGSHRELMAANGAYAAMVRAFSSGVLEAD